ncbi:MAG TPA: c-type cytochrome [Blastocatellia bacterium]|nr:c-type cytochrome [Blastocatellia bacterium]
MSRRYARLAGTWLVITACLVATVDLDAQTGSDKLTRDAARELKSPVPFTKASITRGRTLFAHDCTGCHGTDGKSMIDVIADATDLTEPKVWKSGVSEGEIFRSIRDGAGISMPPFKNQIRKEEDLWHLVNFIRSLWPEPLRPKLQEQPGEHASPKSQ